MKKFYFFLTLLLIAASMAHGRNNQPLEEKFRKTHEKFKQITWKTAHLLSLPKGADNNLYNDPVSLKSLTEILKLDSMVYLIINQQTGSMQKDFLDEYHYNAQLQNTQMFEKEWDAQSNMWVVNASTKLEYDSEGRISIMDFYYYDEDEENLVPEERMRAFYNAEGKPDSVLHYSAIPETTWELSARQIYYYNASGQLINMDIISVGEEDEYYDDDDEYYDDDDDDWIFISIMRIAYTYNDAGQIKNSRILFIEEEMEMLFSETEYIYDNTGRRISSEFSMMNFFTFMVEPVLRTEYEYNASGDISIATTSVWNDEENKWEVNFKDEYTYGNTNFSEVIFPAYHYLFGMEDETAVFYKAPAEINSYAIADGTWSHSEKIIYYYSSGTATNVQPLQTLMVSMFPNPVSSHVTFHWNAPYEQLSLEILQTTGTKIFEKNISSGMEVPVSQLENGLYFYRLMNKQQTILSGKMIKK
jgi:hypothetical protein